MSGNVGVTYRMKILSHWSFQLLAVIATLISLIESFTKYKDLISTYLLPIGILCNVLYSIGNYLLRKKIEEDRKKLNEQHEALKKAADEANLPHIQELIKRLPLYQKFGEGND